MYTQNYHTIRNIIISALFRRIWSREHTKCLSVYLSSVEGVSKIKQFISIIYCAIYRAVCFEFIHFFSGSVRMCIYHIIIIQSELWSISYFNGYIIKQYFALFVLLYSYDAKYIVIFVFRFQRNETKLATALRSRWTRSERVDIQSGLFRGSFPSEKLRNDNFVGYYLQPWSLYLWVADSV